MIVTQNKMKKSCVRVKIGDRVNYESEKVTVLSFEVVPNGANDQRLVLLVFARKDNGNTVSATSDRFTCIDYPYEEFYPSVHLSKLIS